MARLKDFDIEIREESEDSAVIEKVADEEAADDVTDAEE